MNIILKPAEFRAYIESLNDRPAVHRACNELLERLQAKYTVSTISKYLTSYRQELKKIEGNRLTEKISTKKGLITQHIAVNLLNLNKDQNDEVVVKVNLSAE